MGRPLRSDGRQTRQAILDAALDLFADKGYFGTSLRDIARVVGVRESAIYNYFPRKEALFEALIAADVESRAGRLSTLLDEPIDDLQVALEGLATFVLDGFCVPKQQQVFRMLMADGIRLAKAGRINLFERMGNGPARLKELMRRLVREGHLRDGDLDLLVAEFAGPLLWWRHMNAVGADLPMMKNRLAFARGHVERFLDGAAVRERPADAARHEEIPGRRRPTTTAASRRNREERSHGRSYSRDTDTVSQAESGGRRRAGRGSRRALHVADDDGLGSA